MKDKLLALIKNKWWYLVLFLGSSAYVFYYRHSIHQLSELNAQNLIFILWLVLLILPLFSEIEIGNVKLKRSIEQTRAEVKAAVSELRLQIMDLKISNSNMVVVNPPLATKEELAKFEKELESSSKNNSLQELSLNVSADNTFLFQVRLALETLLSSLCDKFQYSERKSMLRMVQYLVRCEVINGNIAGLIQEIIKIANRGVHGEIISADYLDFVKKAFPTVKYALEQANQRFSGSAYFICPHCHYTGPSPSNSICPQCGFASDDD